MHPLGDFRYVLFVDNDRNMLIASTTENIVRFLPVIFKRKPCLYVLLSGFRNSWRINCIDNFHLSKLMFIVLQEEKLISSSWTLKTIKLPYRTYKSCSEVRRISTKGSNCAHSCRTQCSSPRSKLRAIQAQEIKQKDYIIHQNQY